MNWCFSLTLKLINTRNFLKNHQNSLKDRLHDSILQLNVLMIMPQGDECNVAEHCGDNGALLDIVLLLTFFFYLNACPPIMCNSNSTWISQFITMA